MAKGHDSAGAPAGAEAPTENPERWSAARKTDVVLRLLRGVNYFSRSANLIVAGTLRACRQPLAD